MRVELEDAWNELRFSKPPDSFIGRPMHGERRHSWV